MNDTILAALGPVGQSIEWVLNYLKVLVGGVFGLYVIFTIFKIRETIVLKKILKQMTKDMKEMKNEFTLMRDEMNYLKEKK